MAQLKNNRGIALAIVIMIMAVLLSITGASLLFSSLNIKTASNLKAGAGAIHAADAGIQHALALVSSGTTFPYTTETTIFNSFSFGYGYTYMVTAINDSTSPGGNTRAILTSTASGPNGSKRTVKTYIARSSSSSWAPPGTVYLPGQPANVGATFNGNSFLISGNDTIPGQAVGSGSAGPIVGMATTDSNTTTGITGPSGSLGSSQYGQVTGQGENPSVVTLSSGLDVNQLANNLLALGVEGVDKQTWDSGTYKAVDMGTSANPKITHITGNARVTCGNGNHPTAVGYGVLIVDGDLSTIGLFRFNGLIIVRGENVDIHGGGGSSQGATIWGSLLIKESTVSGGGLVIGGNSKVTYSSEAINNVVNRWSSAFPKAARLIAWHEVMQ